MEWIDLFGDQKDALSDVLQEAKESMRLPVTPNLKQLRVLIDPSRCMHQALLFGGSMGSGFYGFGGRSVFRRFWRGCVGLRRISIRRRITLSATTHDSSPSLCVEFDMDHQSHDDPQWAYLSDLQPQSYTCGYCGRVVGPSRGFCVQKQEYAGLPAIYICSYCFRPTYLAVGVQVPGVAFGTPVGNVPEDIDALYNEARNCISVGAYTAAVLACRKLLMNIAVEEGAAENQNFVQYVEYLANQGYVPPNGKGWVDHIRNKGNEATHEIARMEQEDAQDLISFAEMLLKFIYEFPSRIPKP